MMTMTTSLLALFCFILFAFPTNLSSVSADDSPASVLDFTGNNLRIGANYYVLPVIRGHGGGLTAAPSTSNTSNCPLNVVQEQLEVSKGLTLTFTPVNAKKGVVRLSTDLNIKFTTAPVACVTLPVWRLDKFDEQTRQWFVTTGGVEGNPGPQTTGNWFKIEKYADDYYKIVFCPTVCKFCKVLCRDVGFFFHGGQRRLALSDTPLIVTFNKA